MKKIKNNILSIVLWIVYGVLLIKQVVGHCINQQSILYFTVLYFGTALIKYFQSKKLDWLMYGIFVIVLIVLLVFF